MHCYCFITCYLPGPNWVMSVRHGSCAQWGEAVTLAFIHGAQGAKLPSQSWMPGAVLGPGRPLQFLQWVRAWQGLVVQLCCVEGQSVKWAHHCSDPSLMPREDV